MRALHGLVCGSLLLTGCFDAGTDDFPTRGEPGAPVAPGDPGEPGAPGAPGQAATETGEPPTDAHQVPFAPDALARYDFAYVSWNGGAEIRFGNLRGEWSSVQTLEGGVVGAGSLALSPSGHELAYESFDYAQGGWGLDVLSLDSFTTRQVAQDVRAGIRPSWSPDGTLLAVYRWVDDPLDLELELVDATGASAPKPIGQTGGVGREAALRPEWSRDGSEIYFPTTDRIVAYDLRTGASRDVVVAASGESLGLPRLSPDGRTLAFVRDATVELVPAEGGTARPLSSVRNGASYLVWRPDSAALALVDDLFTVGGVGNELRIVGLDGRATHVDWLRSGIGSGDPAWSPDGSRLLYTAFATKHGWADAWLRVFNTHASVALDLGLRGAGYAVTYPTWLRKLPDEQQ